MNEYNYPNRQRQGRLFDPKDYWSKDAHPSTQKSDDLKQYAHELGMIKDLLKVILNKIDIVEERIEVQSDTIEEIADVLFDQ
jgi:hypothetical protein